jgi:hypothetical protein
MQVKTRVKAGGTDRNPNETLVKTKQPTTGLKVKTRVKAGLRTIPTNHNETLVRVQKPTQGLKVKTKIKAGQAFADYGVGRF